jgi:hypothetical protein
MLEGFGLSLAFLRRVAFVPDMEKFYSKDEEY